jgi:histidinol-phosphatase
VTHFTVADDLSLALALAGEADLISADRFGAADLTVDLKPDATHVTDADRAVERVLRDGIEASRPGDAIFGEEYGTQGGGRRQWILDPIDGTANYLRGVPIWGTLIALAIDGEPVVGVVSSPALGRRWWGARGHGAWVAERDAAPKRLGVSGIRSLDDANISYNRIEGWDELGRLEQVLTLTRRAWRARGIGDMWSYMLLAEGALDVVTEPDLQPYDMAALVPIIEEAGGRFTSIEGEPGPWHGSALATNGHLHDEVRSILAG